LIETILVYKLPTLSREEIQAMLELTDVDLKQTRFYQDVFTEGRLEGGQEEVAADSLFTPAVVEG
jgi:predicted transposase YdaD